MNDAQRKQWIGSVFLTSEDVAYLLQALEEEHMHMTAAWLKSKVLESKEK